MKKKLTLTIEESITRNAKRMARREGVSVSEIVERYLAEKISGETGWTPEEGSWTSGMMGSLHLPEKLDDSDYKTIKEREIFKKYDL
ncbi:MAG: DUF6364 family protein [Balneolaceae bacterium]